VAAAVVRLVTAIGRRVADGDPEDLTELLRVDRAVAEAYRAGVDGLRAAGRSDGEIGAVLGVTRQAVAQRWPRVAVVQPAAEPPNFSVRGGGP
jgi:hypothetical protein